MTVVALLTAAVPAPGLAQPTAPAQNRPAPLDLDTVRRDAARLAEIRGLLADPDPNVRMLTMRETLRAGNPAQRQLALEAGLASADSAMVELALRSVLADTQQVVISLSAIDSTPAQSAGRAARRPTREASSLVLTITSFDVDTGKFSGPLFSGQLQGTVLSFVRRNVSGKLVWDSEAAEFRGTVNLMNNFADWDRGASWRPR